MSDLFFLNEIHALSTFRGMMQHCQHLPVQGLSSYVLDTLTCQSLSTHARRFEKECK